MGTANLALFTDASSANAHDLKILLGFVVLVMDHAGNANMPHYGSIRCRYVARFLIASEIHAVILGFHIRSLMQSLLEDVTGRKAPIEAYVSLNTVFDMISKESNSTECRLQIYIATISESYEEGELARFSSMPRARTLQTQSRKHKSGDCTHGWL